MPVKYSRNSPLRYPGSKAPLVPYIQQLLESNRMVGCTFVEPYAGSAIASLQLLADGIIGHSVLVERDPLIYAFWFSVFNHTESLINKIAQTDITIETWHELQLYRSLDTIRDFDIVDIGFAGLFFNRTNFSGILKAGPLGGLSQRSKYPIDCRFNKHRIITLIQEISELREHVEIFFDDAQLFLRRFLNENRNRHHDQQFLYIDPPYYQKGKQLYRYWFNQEQHEALSRQLGRTRIPWLVSYDDHPEIRHLYENGNNLHLLRTYFDYTVHKTRTNAQELLISNLPLPPVETSLQQSK